MTPLPPLNASRRSTQIICPYLVPTPTDGSLRTIALRLVQTLRLQPSRHQGPYRLLSLTFSVEGPLFSRDARHSPTLILRWPELYQSSFSSPPSAKIIARPPARCVPRAPPPTSNPFCRPPFHFSQRCGPETAPGLLKRIRLDRPHFKQQ